MINIYEKLKPKAFNWQINEYDINENGLFGVSMSIPASA